jgi:hypothetical protein
MALPPGVVIIYCQGIFTSQGFLNGKPRGAAVATLYIGNTIWEHTLITLRESITKLNAQLAAFQPALTLAKDYLREHQSQIIYILNSAKLAVPKFMNTRPGPN